MTPGLTDRFGPAPYRIFCIHGGPGGIGAMDDCAAELHRRLGCGVRAPRQGCYSVGALCDELNAQLAEPDSPPPVVLIGHSWGAWLAMLAARRAPERVGRLVLVGCPPLRDGFDVDAARQRRFGAADRLEFETLLRELKAAPESEQARLLAGLGAICERADTYCRWDGATDNARCEFDGLMFNRVWPEAARLRSAGEIARIFAGLTVPTVVIQGRLDPHSTAGVRCVREAAGPREFVELARCGHTPWREAYARETFFDKICTIAK